MRLEVVAEVPEIAGQLDARGLVHLFLVCGVEPCLIIGIVLGFQHVFELDRIHV